MNDRLSTMNKTEKTPEAPGKAGKKKEKKRIRKDLKTGLFVLTGPSFTKEDIARDFPEDSDRDAIIIRRSVGL